MKVRKRNYKKAVRDKRLKMKKWLLPSLIVCGFAVLYVDLTSSVTGQNTVNILEKMWAFVLFFNPDSNMIF